MRNIHALLVVDVQNDFCPGGALPVPDGDAVIPVLNEYIALFAKDDLPIFASRDWHPPVTRHFSTYGGKWPSHCVQNTPGARFHPDLKLPERTSVLSKGMDPDEEGYTAFQGVDHSGHTFRQLIESMNIKQLSIGGLATDYCVKWSVLHAREHGLGVNLLIDATRGVNVQPDDSREAIRLMVEKGAIPVTMQRISL